MAELLFSPYDLAGVRLASRVVMAPMTRNRAPGSVPNALMAAYYAARADPRTGAALVVTEATAISQQGQGSSDVPGLYTPAQLDGWRRVTRAVHARGGRIFCQIWHVGRISNCVLQPGGAAPVAPSAIRADERTFVALDGAPPAFVATSMPRALRREEIAGIVADYAAAARGALAVAGFDGVEIHGANGYLPEQFLKTSTNRREDDWGGSIANRCRFVVEVARAVIAAAGGAPVGLRISPASTVNDIHDDDPQALYEHLLRELGPLGLAYIHVIEGSLGRHRGDAEPPMDHAALRRAWHAAGGSGAWIVNHHYDRASAEAALASGRADLVAFGKPFIAMPDFSERMRRGGPFVKPDRAAFYGGGAKGYVGYPTLPAG